jgi:predicted metal-dependent phosphotriesterase family hydrolase
MRVFIALMLKCGFTENEIEMMVKSNPGRMLYE